MRFTKDLAYQHRATQQREGEKDLKEKFAVILILRKLFGLYGLTGEIVQITDDTCRCPDIMIKSIQTVLELDGEIHGSGDDVTRRPRDIERDADYATVDIKCIVINKELTSNYDTGKIAKILEQNGLKRIA